MRGFFVLNYSIFGENNRETIVFLHSGLQTGMNDFGHIVKEFSDKYKVIVPDLPGHGKSEVDENIDYSSNPYLYFLNSADELKNLLDELGIREANIVGVSLGALVAVNFANQYQRYVKSINVSGLMFVKPRDYDIMHENDKNNMQMLLQDKEASSYLDNLHETNWRIFVDVAQHDNWYPFEDNQTFLTIGVRKYAILGEKAEHEVKSLHRAKDKNINYTIIKDSGHLVNHENAKEYVKALQRNI